MKNRSLKTEIKAEVVTLNQLFKQIVDKTSYIEAMLELGETRNYKLLDKFHYMVEEKLHLGSFLYSKNPQILGGSIYCNCGNYIGDKLYAYDQVWLGFSEENSHVLLWENKECYYCGPKEIQCGNCGIVLLYQEDEDKFISLSEEEYHEVKKICEELEE